eukprot:g7520.t1
MSSRTEETGSVNIRPTRPTPQTTSEPEIQPASTSEESTDSAPSLSIPDLVEQLRVHTEDSIDPVLSELIQLTKERNEHHTKELISNGVLHPLFQILSDDVSYDLEIRIRVAAAICNLAQTHISQRGFASCSGVRILAEFVIGDHQALTGASAVILKSMLKSDYLVSTMIENKIPLCVIRAFLLCTDGEISDIVVDALIQMTAIDALKEFMLEHRTVQICIELLHILACRHYHLIAKTRAENSDQSPPSFVSQSKRDILMLHLMPHKNEKTKQRESWESKFGEESFLMEPEDEGEFTKVDGIRVSLLLELLSWLLLNSSDACNQFMILPFALDVFQYWMQNGNALMKQTALLSTSLLLRNGHRAFVTLRDIINVIYNVLIDDKRHSGVNQIQYKGIAVETLNELCIYGGDNMSLATNAAGVLSPLLALLEMEDYQLQHLTLRAMNSVCSHICPVRTLVSNGGIPYLCEFLDNGLKELTKQRKTQKKSPLTKVALGCLSRKHLESMDRELEAEEVHKDDYSKIRRLDYCLAVLRTITSFQSREWLSILDKCRIVSLSLNALNQIHSNVAQKQALGILTSLVTMKDSSAAMTIASNNGCGPLLELLGQSQRSQEQESIHWIACIKLVLYHIAQEPQAKKTLQNAVRAHYGGQLETSDNSLYRMFTPNQDHLNLEWFSSCV